MQCMIGDMMIRTKTIAEAHEAVVTMIFKYGEEIVTEDKELTFEWDVSDPIVIEVTDPLCEPVISSACLFGRKRTEIYGENMLKITPPMPNGFSYTYPNRLLDYPVKSYVGEWFGNGKGDGINQIDSIVNKLVKNPTSRRAIAHTWVNEIDLDSSEPPCLQTVQCFVRNNKVNMVCYFRSNDMLSAWGQNAYGLSRLLEYIVGKINATGYCEYDVGTLTTISASAHIYWDRDQQELNSFRRHLNV